MMKKLSVLLLALLLPMVAHAETAGTTIRLKHSVTNLSTTVPAMVFGTLATQRPSFRLEIENSSLSGTLVLATGCTTIGNGFKNVLFVQPGVSKNVPLTVGEASCLMVFAADSAITAGNSTYTLFWAD